MNSKKMLAIAVAIFAVVCVFATLVFTGVISFDGLKKDIEAPTTDSVNIGYTQSIEGVAKAVNSIVEPYFKTDIEDIYYTVATDGTVKFFSFDGGIFTPVEATGTYETTVTLSEQDIDAKITYLEKDGVVSGYGLYRAPAGEYSLYEYAFFRLRNYGKNYNDAASTSCLLLVDTDVDDFYSNDKIYEECFRFKFSDSSVSSILLEASRTVGMNGAKRDDYFKMNDSIIDASTNHMLFYSGRRYQQGDGRFDLYRSGGSGNNVDNINLCENILANTVFYVDEKVMFLTADESGTVILNAYEDDEVSEVKKFDGISVNDILVSDDYIYFISANKIYNVAEDKEITVTGLSNGFKADAFCANGDKFIVRGYSKFPEIIIASLAEGKIEKQVSNELFEKAVNFTALSDGSFMFDIQSEAGFTSYIF